MHCTPPEPVSMLVGANENAVSVGAVVSWFDETPSVVWKATVLEDGLAAEDVVPSDKLLLPLCEPLDTVLDMAHHGSELHLEVAADLAQTAVAPSRGAQRPGSNHHRSRSAQVARHPGRVRRRYARVARGGRGIDFRRTRLRARHHERGPDRGLADLGRRDRRCSSGRRARSCPSNQRGRFVPSCSAFSSSRLAT